MHRQGFRFETRRLSVRRPQRLRAYTLIELILVIVLLGTLGAVAGPRFFDNSAFDERAYYDELAASLRYAQTVAVASGCPVRATITATTYALSQQPASGGHCDSSSTSFPTPVMLPSGEPMQGTAPGSVTVSPAISVVFDALGRTSLASDQSLTIGPRSLVVRAESGLIDTS